jgi:DNA polymerase III subunit delta
MKFSSLPSFETHLKKSYPNHLAPFFFIVAPSEHERKQITNQIIHLTNPAHLLRFNGTETTVNIVKIELLTPTFWGGTTVIFYDNVDKVDNLTDLFVPLPKQVYLILGAKSFKSLEDLYQKGKKEIVGLDLSNEKPWEKEKRLQTYLIQKAETLQKTLSTECLEFLIQNFSHDFATLSQEFAKLLCYVGNKEKLQLTEAKAICSSQDLLTGWQLSKTFVWKHPIQLPEGTFNLNFILPFLGQLRHQFQLGYQISEIATQKKSTADIQHRFPTVYHIKNYVEIAKSRTVSFFSSGLQALFELEFAIKSSSMDLKLLFDFFQGKVYEKTLHSPQSHS